MDSAGVRFAVDISRYPCVYVVLCQLFALPDRLAKRWVNRGEQLAYWPQNLSAQSTRTECDTLQTFILSSISCEAGYNTQCITVLCIAKRGSNTDQTVFASLFLADEARKRECELILHRRNHRDSPHALAADHVSPGRVHNGHHPFPRTPGRRKAVLPTRDTASSPCIRGVKILLSFFGMSVCAQRTSGENVAFKAISCYSVTHKVREIGARSTLLREPALIHEISHRFCVAIAWIAPPCGRRSHVHIS